MEQVQRRTVYAVTIVTMLVFAGGFALAATLGSLGTANQNSSAGGGSVGPLNGVTIETANILSNNPGATHLGAQTAGTPAGALAGTEVAIATCATAATVCIDPAAYIPATSDSAGTEGPTAIASDYSEQLTISVNAGTPNFDLTITFAGQTVTPSIVYVSTSGITGAGASDLIYIYIDLGPTTPTITSYSVIGNSCVATCV